MTTISLCMIVKNEEHTLPTCLNSVRDIVDEIIIVDTGSEDDTVQVAKRYTPHVYSFEWIDDFSAARNFAFSKATMEYQFWLDADDILLPPDAAALLALKDTLNPAVDVVMMRYNTAFDKDGNPTFTFFRERLLKRAKNFVWKEPVHECMEIHGNIYRVNIAVTHNKKGGGHSRGRNLRIYEKLLDSGKELSPRSQYYFARELRDNGRFEEGATWFARFLEEDRGWKEDKIAACGALGECLLRQGRREEALQAMFKSFLYDIPRAERCCEIGYWFKGQPNPALAVYWFELALTLPRADMAPGFVQPDYWGYIPCLELAVCYHLLGDTKKASEYNERAEGYKPGTPAVEHNRRFFTASLHPPTS